MTGTITVDLGKTTCRGVVTTPQGRRRLTGPGAPGLGAPNGVDAAVESILALGEPLQDKAIGVGAAGGLGAPDALAQLVGRLLALGASQVMVTSDVTTAHAGALGGSPGVVLIIGTGAVALSVSGDGRLRRVDGWGPLLGDAGSGGWIGREGLAAALAAFDGRGPQTALTDAAGSAYGVTLTQLPAVVTDGRDCGRFAPHVAAAARAGDAVAARILRQAAHALADTVCAALPDPTQETAAVIVGGLVALDDMLLKPLRHNVSRRALVDWRAPLGDALAGAELLLERPDTALEPQVTRSPPTG